MTINTREDITIKIQSIIIETSHLVHEYKILEHFQNIKGFPYIFLFTLIDDSLVRIMELLHDDDLKK